MPKEKKFDLKAKLKVLARHSKDSKICFDIYEKNKKSIDENSRALAEVILGLQNQSEYMGAQCFFYEYRKVSAEDLSKVIQRWEEEKKDYNFVEFSKLLALFDENHQQFSQVKRNLWMHEFRDLYCVLKQKVEKAHTKKEKNL